MFALQTLLGLFGPKVSQSPPLLFWGFLGFFGLRPKTGKAKPLLGGFLAYFSFFWGFWGNIFTPVPTPTFGPHGPKSGVSLWGNFSFFGVTFYPSPHPHFWAPWAQKWGEERGKYFPFFLILGNPVSTPTFGDFLGPSAPKIGVETGVSFSFLRKFWGKIFTPVSTPTFGANFPLFPKKRGKKPLFGGATLGSE